MKTCALFRHKAAIEPEENALSELLVGKTVSSACRMEDGYHIGLGDDYMLVITGDFVIGLVEYRKNVVN